MYRTSPDIDGTIALLMMMQHFKNGTSHAQNDEEKQRAKKKKE
jgi:hypothetical protein